jgi:hypothetical protein
MVVTNTAMKLIFSSIQAYRGNTGNPFRTHSEGDHPALDRDQIAAHQPWSPADEPAATICRNDAGYELKEARIAENTQPYRVMTGPGEEEALRPGPRGV